MSRHDALHELVARRADRSGQAAAVRQGELALTYAELQQLAVQLAAELACAGVGEEHVVALDLPSSPRMIAAMLAAGILGAAFLPIDQRDPAARRAFLVEDSAAAAVVTEDAVRATDAAVRLDVRLPRVASKAAYVSYTSGSTGRPKGVVTEQHAVVNYIESAVAEYRLRPGDRQLQFASPAFDIAIEEVFSTLAAGATLVLREPDFVYEDVFDFLRLADERGLTVLNLPTGVWNQFGLELRRRPQAVLPLGVRLMVVGGEAASPDACAAWHAAARDATFRIVNSYGPTEAAVAVTFADLLPGQPVTIGRPIPGVEVFPVDEQLRPLGVGAVGELLILGAAPARGYLGLPRDADGRFGQSPLGRHYRTGDLGLLRPDGVLEYRGRIDDQVKVRGGFRVEPGEVARVLQAHPAVTAAHVQAVERGASRVLAAFVTGAPTPREELHGWCAQRLPDYMVPVVFEHVDAIALTDRGKVDTKALAALLAARTPAAGAESDALSGASGTDAFAHLDTLRAAVAQSWLHVLGTEPLGADGGLDEQANFFEDGGDSFTAVEFLDALRGTLGYALPLRALYRDPSAGALVRELLVDDTGIPEAHHTTGRTVVRLRRAGSGRLWCFLPPLSGAVTRYARLARLLPPADAVWACETSAEISGAGMDVLAKGIADALLTEGVAGFERIAVSGYSLGGVFALEVARRLAAVPGLRDRLEVLLLDPPGPGDPQADIPEAFDVFVRVGWRVPEPSAGFVRADGSFDLAGVAAAARRAGTLPQGAGDEEIENAWRAYASNATIMDGWSVEPLPRVPTALLRCRVEHAGAPTPWVADEPSPAWVGAVAPGRTWALPVEHYSMLEPPNDATVAAWLEATSAGAGRG